jgi:hypothetical protein
MQGRHQGGQGYSNGNAGNGAQGNGAPGNGAQGSGAQANGASYGNESAPPAAPQHSTPHDPDSSGNV